MKIPIYQVDAFAKDQFSGNPAAVCILDTWLDDKLLQSIAAENNLAETAFILRNKDGSYHIRWFTPTFEIPLCGHATLAAGYVLYQYYGSKDPVVHFHSLSGDLFVEKSGDLFILDFPAYEAEPAKITDSIVTALGTPPDSFYRAGINFYALFDKEDQVRELLPDYKLILDIIRDTEIIGIVATAAAKDYDFISRYLAPEEGTGITEDPVTGSIHSVLVPFWAKRLGKTKLHAFQASPRGGELFCEFREKKGVHRVMIGGYVQPYFQGYIELNNT